VSTPQGFPPNELGGFRDERVRMPTPTARVATRLALELTTAIDQISPEDLPALLAALAAYLAQASAKLLAQPQAIPALPDSAENLSVAEASRRLGVSVDWLYRNHKRLPFTRRIGRRLLFSARGLDRWNSHRR